MQESASLEKNALQRTVGEVVAADYRTAGIFEEHGIDFCCGGNVSLAVICQEKGLDPAILLREIATVNREAVDRSQNYAAWELPFLADYIVNTHHAYLKEVDGELAAYTGKIAQVHGSHHPEVIEIATIFGKIASDMVIHLREEEEVFFPALKRAAAAAKTGAVAAAQDRATISASLTKLIREHEVIGDAVHTIRHLAKAYEIPEDACNTFALTYRKLKEFEDDLHKHVHLENNILFPKAALL